MRVSIGGDSGVKNELIKVSRQNGSRGDVGSGLCVQRVGQGGKINFLFPRSSEEFGRELVCPLFGEGGG